MKVMFAGGGTAGHINPALAIAKGIKEKKTDSEILFVGTKNSMESDLVPKAGFPIEFVDITGFKRKLSLDNVKTIFRFLSSVGRCKTLIREFEPDVVVGTGGYVSGPLLYAAHRRKIPCAIQEQNAVPGVTTKFLSRYADRIFISFEESRKLMKHPERCQLAGNPIRPELFSTSYKEARSQLGLKDEFFILCVAGSLGAQRINEVMMDVIPQIGGRSGVKLFLATGDRYYQRVTAKIASPPQNVTIEKYIYNMECLLNAADLVISRGGAITLSEITALEKPSILIPSPNVTNNHQFYNADALKQGGAAVLIEEKDLTADRILSVVDDLIQSPKKREQMKISSAKLSHRDATQIITRGVLELARKR